MATIDPKLKTDLKDLDTLLGKLAAFLSVSHHLWYLPYDDEDVVRVGMSLSDLIKEGDLKGILGACMRIRKMNDKTPWPYKNALGSQVQSVISTLQRAGVEEGVWHKKDYEAIMEKMKEDAHRSRCKCEGTCYWDRINLRRSQHESVDSSLASVASTSNQDTSNAP